ncbi:MAG TPA: FG-GAP-like repeat-containing protein [Chitinophagales bacterium]|nr:FG-GAP-like repeat-containing protein [Chitinophagales bacterium]
MKHFPEKISFALFIALSATEIFAQTFTKSSMQAGINHFTYTPNQIGGGAAFFDYDNDGWLDLYLTGGLKRDLLYHNNGNGTFTETGIAAGLGITGNIFTMGVVTGDIDNDGYRDIFVTTYGSTTDLMGILPNLLFRNNGNGTFTNISSAAGITHASRSVSASMGDYNLDGFLDIYVANYFATSGFIRDSNNVIVGYAHTGYPDFLYKNNGNSTFTLVSPQLGVDNPGTALAAAFTDYDNDNDVDIYAVNDFGEWDTPNKLYRNEYPVDSFTDVSAASGADIALYGMGVAIGDYDEDSDFDYYITNIGFNALLRNNGNGSFDDIAQQAGVAHGIIDSIAYSTGWGTGFLDYDNDTWLDLFVVDGWIASLDFLPTSEKDPNKLFKNNGNGTFTDVSVMEGVSDSLMKRGFAMADYDNDGDLDMLAVALEQDTLFQQGARTILYRNDILNGNRWLKIQLQGTQNNFDAFGSRVEVYAGGRKFIREIDGGSSHASQHSSIAHFGMANYNNADSIRVVWPGGATQILYNISTNRLIKIIEGGPTQLFTDIHYEICMGDSVLAGGSFRKNSGTYYDTLLSSVGLDSIIITYLTVHPVPITQFHFEACEGDSVLVNGKYYASDTIIHDTLSSHYGCDSIIVTTVSIMPNPLTFATATICLGDSFFAGGIWHTQPGIYNDTVTTALCNKITITELNVIPPHASDLITVTICPGDSAWIGGAFRYTEDFYFDTITSSLGCDSIVITWLEVFDVHPVAWHISRCANDTFYLEGKPITVSGIYYDTVANASGCDSIAEIFLTIVPAISVQRDTFIMEGDSIFLGKAWQSQSGIYEDVFLGSNGCDSIVITELSIVSRVTDTPDNPEFVAIFPNPVHNDITISFSLHETDIIQIQLIPLTPGEKRIKLFNGRIPAGHHSLKLNNVNVPSSIYILSFSTSHNTRYIKIAVM